MPSASGRAAIDRRVGPAASRRCNRYQTRRVCASERVEHLGRGRDLAADRRRGCDARARRKSHRASRAATVAPSALCAASTTTSGCRLHDLEAARHRRPRRAPLDDIVVERPERRTPRPRRSQSPRCRPDARREATRTPLVHVRRGAHIDQPAPDGQPILHHGEVPLRARDDRLRAFVEEDATQVRVGLAEHQRRVRLDDAGLLVGDPLAPSPSTVGVVLARRW